MNDSRPDASAIALRNQAGKRERLASAAADLFYKNGVERTTIADIAVAAYVPMGNVYYYYKTKDDIVSAVVSARVGELAAGVRVLEDAHESPAARLKAWFYAMASHADLISQYGCPFGTLSTELEKRARGGDKHVAQLLRAPTDWAEQQFHLMGRLDASQLAIELISSYQGTAVLAHAFALPDILTRKADQISQWIDALEA